MRLRAPAALLVCLVRSLWPDAALAQEPLTLSQALVVGRQRAPEIAGARANVVQENADARAARATLYPSLTATMQAQGNGLRDTPMVRPHVTPPLVTYTGAAIGSAALRWTLYDFGRTSNAIRSADATALAASASLDDTDETVISNVANAYITLAYREELRKTANVTVVQRDKLAQLAKGLVKHNLQPPVEEIRSESRLEAARRTLADAEADALDAREALVALLGVGRDFQVMKPRLPSVDTDVGRAMKAADGRDVLRAGRASVDALNAARDAAVAKYRPTLSLTGDGSYRFANIDFGEAATTTRTVTAGIVLTGPLFDATIAPAVDHAAMAAAIGEATLEQLTRDTRSEGARAAVGVRGAADTLEHAKKAEEQSAVVFSVVEARYEQGLAASTELIEAEASDVDARTARTQAEMAYALSIVRLLVATKQSKRLLSETTGRPGPT